MWESSIKCYLSLKLPWRHSVLACLYCLLKVYRLWFVSDVIEYVAYFQLHDEWGIKDSQ